MRCSTFWVDRWEKISNTTATKIPGPKDPRKSPHTMELVLPDGAH